MLLHMGGIISFGLKTVWDVLSGHNTSHDFSMIVLILKRTGTQVQLDTAK